MTLASVPTLTETAVFQLLSKAEELRLPADARRGVLALGTNAVGPLLAIVLDDDLSMRDAPGGGWAPGHAARLLGELKAVEAVEPLLRRLAETGPEDWLRDSLTVALSAMGPGAVEATLRAHDATADDELRDHHCEILADLGARDERIFERLLQQLRRRPGFGATTVAKYGDPRAVPALLEAFDRFEVSEKPSLFVNQDLIDLEDAIVHLGGALSQDQAAKLAGAMRFRDEVWADFRAQSATKAASTPIRGAAKLGRNDRCWCGSGKKLKKCHRD